MQETTDIEVVDFAQWDDAVADLGGDSVYHSLAYHKASAHLEDRGTVPTLLRQAQDDASWLLPLLLRPLPDGTGWDATSAYGYGGPIARSGVATERVRLEVDRWAKNNDVVATFIRFDPLLDNARWAPAGISLSSGSPTVIWNLAGTHDLREAMHAHHRRGARKADRSGLEVHVTSSPADLDSFRAMYEVTMTRQLADDFYFFPESYWRDLLKLRSRLVLVDGSVGGTNVASLLCFQTDTTLHYHLGASSDDARQIAANTRLFLGAAEYGRTQGLRQLHLGGGLGGDGASSLFEFKRRLCPTGPEATFVTGRWIHDQVRYESIASIWPSTDFFPPWRAR